MQIKTKNKNKKQKQKKAWVAEWSNACDLRSHPIRFVGSNPTLCTKWFLYSNKTNFKIVVF